MNRQFILRQKDAFNVNNQGAPLGELGELLDSAVGLFGLGSSADQNRMNKRKRLGGLGKRASCNNMIACAFRDIGI